MRQKLSVEEKKIRRKAYRDRPESKEKKRIAAKIWREKPAVKARKKELYSIWIQKPENKEIVKGWQEAYLSKPGKKDLHNARIRKIQADRRKENPKLFDERTKISREKPGNKEKRADWVRDYNSRPEVKERRAIYSKAKVISPEAKKRINARLREYRQRPEVKAARTKYAAPSMSRARLYGCEIVPFLAKDVYERDGYICQYCNGAVKESRSYCMKRATIDHVIPLSRGGAHSADNCVTCCQQCNSKKGRLTRDEFLYIQPSHEPLLQRV